MTARTIARHPAYVEHVGDVSPVTANTPVWVCLGDDQPLIDSAGVLNWGPGLGPAGEGQIHRWAPVAIPHT